MSHNKCTSCHWALVISLAAIIISFFVLIRYEVRIEDPRFDYQGVIVTTLGVLVTILVGWQIYQVIEVKDIKDECENLKDDLQKEVNYIHNKVDYFRYLSDIGQAQNLSLIANKDNCSIVYFKGMMLILTSIKHLSQMREFDDCETALSVALDLETFSNDIKLSYNEADVLLQIFAEIPNRSKLLGLEPILS